MIDVEQFSYDYGSKRAVDGISFHLSKGEIVALIGPNGAGKSTTMKAITTQFQPSAGRIRIAGFDTAKEPMQVRKRLGYLPENNPLYGDLFVYDALRFMAQQRLMPKASIAKAIERAADRCGLNEVMHKRIDTLSKGYRQRVGIAQAIIADPELLILDEATSGLDPNQIRDIRELICEIGKERTVLLSTHILQEVQAVAQRIIILNKGKIAVDGQIADIAQKLAPELGHTPSLEALFHHYTL